MAAARRVITSGSASSGARARRGGWRRWRHLPLVIVLGALLEGLTLYFLGSRLGILWLLLIVVLATVIGLWLIKREGPRAWRAVRSAAGEGRVPAPEAVRGVLVLLAGILLLFPGLLTDVAAIVLLLPPVGNAIGRMVARRMERRVGGAFAQAGLAPPPVSWGTERGRSRTRIPRPRRRTPPEIVEGEIIED